MTPSQRAPIGIVTTWFDRGAAYVSKLYAQALEKAGYKVFIYARGGERKAVGDPAWDYPAVTWAEQGIVPAEASIDLSNFKAWLHRTGVQSVLFNEQWWWEPVVTCHDRGIKTAAYVVEYRTDELELYRLYDVLICNSRIHYDLFKELHPRCEFIRWGTDIETFRPRQTDLVEQGHVTFVHLAGMNPERKGSDLVLKAFAQTRGTSRLKMFAQLDVFEVFPHLRSLALDLIAAGRLEYSPGNKRSPAELYQQGDVLVYPSRFDGLGLSIAEAMAAGLVVIASDFAPLNENAYERAYWGIEISYTLPHPGLRHWPLREPSLDHLGSTMEWLSAPENQSEVSKGKRSAREFAERELDWEKNSTVALDRIFSDLTYRPQRAARNKARAFEAGRARRSVKYWLAYHFPWILVRLRSAYRRLKSR